MSKDRNTTRKKGDAQTLLNNAVAFWEAADRCYRMAHSRVGSSGRRVQVSGPAVVCYAFSVELFLKLLGQRASGTYLGSEHALDELFQHLPEKLRAKIQAHYASAGQPTGSDVAYHLHKAARAFKEWRYVHEHDPRERDGEPLDADPEALARIVFALRETMHEVAPELVSFLDA